MITAPAKITGDFHIQPLIDAGFALELQLEPMCAIVSLTKKDVSIVILGHHIDVVYPLNGEQDIRVFPGLDALPEAAEFAIEMAA